MEPHIVEAVGSASAEGGMGKSDFSRQIEEAMSQAVLQALADGVSMENTEEILRRKQEARQRVMKG